MVAKKETSNLIKTTKYFHPLPGCGTLAITSFIKSYIGTYLLCPFVFATLAARQHIRALLNNNYTLAQHFRRGSQPFICTTRTTQCNFLPPIFRKIPPSPDKVYDNSQCY
jgi:hypothetical protein